MRNWFDIAPPHEDIRRGSLDEAVFAADLGDVAAGTAAADYSDPYLFFKKTYLTQGLERILNLVYEKLTNGTGSGVVELQTPFGGGKTHALVTIFHYLKNGRQVQELLPKGLSLVPEPATSVVVGTQLNPATGSISDGVTRQTIWGEIAYQLGGLEAYSNLEQNDRERLSPGKTDLLPLLQACQPCVLLFDEILEYVVKARGVRVEESSLAAQTLSFFKALTEVVAGLPKAQMIVTLPSSDLEDFGDREQHNLSQLEKIFGRLESIESPVADEEVHSIVRQRLFEPLKDDAAMREVIDAYFQTYQRQKNELPRKASELEFRRQMERSYPFHPDVINVLYEKWSTFPSFQRTRGALRLLANVIEDLYQSERNIDLILPGDINLSRPQVRREFLKHIGQEYDGIVASDISGSDAKSAAMDRQNHGWKHLAERIATSAFFHSFTAGESESGATLADLKLAVLRPETTAPLVTEIIQKQATELWYLNQKGKRYYFSNVPNLNRMVLDKKQLLPKDEVREELQRVVKRELGSRFRCYQWPHSSDDVPDGRNLKLAVLDPQYPISDVDLQAWIERRGQGFREYRNTLFFAVPDEGRHGRILDDIRTRLALQGIRDELAGSDRPGIAERKAEIERRLAAVEGDLPQRVREVYRTVAVPRAGGELELIDLGQPTVGRENLDSWYWRELTDPAHQKILENPPSAATLTVKFLQNGKPVSLAAVLDQFYKDPGLPVPADSSVIASAISKGVEEGALGVGYGSAEDIKPESVRFAETMLALDVAFDEDVFLLSGEVARALKEQAVGAEVPAGGSTEPGGETAAGTSTVGPGVEGTTPVEGAGSTGQEVERLNRVAFKATGVPVQKLADLHRGVLLPLSREVGNFEFALEIDVSSAEGISKKVVESQVMETLRQLGAKVDNQTTE